MLRHHKIKIKDDTADSSKGSGLMHHKFVVVDGKKLIVTSANFTMSDVHGDVLQRETTGNANAMIVFESEAMTAKFQEEFIIMWGRRGKKAAFGLNKPYRGVQKTQVNAETKISVQFSPTSRKMNWSDSTNGLIGKTLATAEHETLVALFAFSEQRLSRILESVYLRNEKFNLGVLVEPKFAYRRFSEVLDIWGIALRDANCDYEADNNPWKVPFMGAGIPILERGDMLHHKFAVVDGSKVIFGSQNWSGAANNSNDENILIVENSYIASQFRTEFYRLERYSRKGPTRNLLQEIDRIETKCSGTIDTF
jgi:phosphatidylserine/phosphatidylglycerophosphate/cardiolipin synthase-like enzyme